MLPCHGRTFAVQGFLTLGSSAGDSAGKGLQHLSEHETLSRRSKLGVLEVKSLAAAEAVYGTNKSLTRCTYAECNSELMVVERPKCRKSQSGDPPDPISRWLLDVRAPGGDIGGPVPCAR